MRHRSTTWDFEVSQWSKNRTWKNRRRKKIIQLKSRYTPKFKMYTENDDLEAVKPPLYWILIWLMTVWRIHVEFLGMCVLFILCFSIFSCYWNVHKDVPTQNCKLERTCLATFLNTPWTLRQVVWERAVDTMTWHTSERVPCSAGGLTMIDMHSIHHSEVSRLIS